MSRSSSQRSAAALPSRWLGGHGVNTGGRRARPDELNERRRGREVRPESLSEREWDGLVAREVDYQARIEEAFDRADACDRLGDLDLALDWLDKADSLSGGLSPAYRSERARMARRAARADGAFEIGPEA
jgi:hypothetical protein